MAEVEEKTETEVKNELGDQSIQQINQISHMIKTYYRTLFPNMTSDEYYLIGLNTILSGLQIISRSQDMDGLDVDGRISLMKATMTIVNNVLDKVYLNPEVVAGMVAQTTMHKAKNSLINKK